MGLLKPIKKILASVLTVAFFLNSTIGYAQNDTLAAKLRTTKPEFRDMFMAREILASHRVVNEHIEKAFKGEKAVRTKFLLNLRKSKFYQDRKSVV